MSNDTNKELADFEAWWEDCGQYCRAGGGDYEKTFAYRAWEFRAATQPAPIPAQTGTLRFKDHNIRQLVNDLRDIALTFHATQQLRARIQDAVGQFLATPTAPGAGNAVTDEAKEARWVVFGGRRIGKNYLAELERELAAAKAALRLFEGAAYPVSTDIDARGYRWSEAYLDQARAVAIASHTKAEQAGSEP